MRIRLALLAFLAMSANARADVLYDFVSACKSAPLAACFRRIEHELDEARTGAEGRLFCIPPVWGGNLIATTVYPVSVLDYILLRLSAARVGRAGQPVQQVLRDTLAELFPCRTAARR